MTKGVPSAKGVSFVATLRNNIDIGHIKSRIIYNPARSVTPFGSPMPGMGLDMSKKFNDPLYAGKSDVKNAVQGGCTF